MYHNDVFLTQSVFRKLVDAFSHPGKILLLDREAESLQVDAEINPLFLLIAKTLLDVETTFYISQDKASPFIAHLTYAKPSDPASADFIFLPSIHSEEYSEIVKQSAIGSLTDPHKGALVVLEIKEITTDHDLRLRGPGIQAEKSLGLAPLDPELLRLRDEKCKEYPLGMDLLLIDELGQMVALPRTTEISSWDM